MSDPTPPTAASQADLRTYERFLEALPAAAYVCSKDGRITFFNRHAAQLWGRQPLIDDPGDRFCGSYRLFATDGSPIAHEHCWMGKTLATGESFHGQEILIERPDGTRAVVLAHASPIKDDAGELVGAVNILIDTSERFHAQHAETLLAALVESSEDAIVSKTLEGRILSWNVGAERLFGYTAAEMIGRHMTLLAPPERLHEEPEILAKLRQGQAIDPFETIRVHKNGRRIDVSMRISPIRDASGATIAASNVSRDVTASKRTMAVLRESEHRFAKFMEHLPGLAWIKDLEGRYVFVNEAAATAFQRPRSEICGHLDEELFPADTAHQFRVNDQRVVDTCAGVEVIETLEHRDGLHHAIVSKFPILGPDGVVSLLGGIAIDVTDRRRTEAALRESETRFRNMADTVPVLIWVNGIEGCEFVNREYLRFLGCEASAVAGLGWTRFVHPDDLDGYAAAYRRSFAGREVFDARFRFRRASGEYRWLRSTAVPRFDATGAFLGFVGCSTDIDDVVRSADALTDARDQLSRQLDDLHRLHELGSRLSTTLELEPILDETLRTAAEIAETDLGVLSLCDETESVLRIGATLGFDASVHHHFDRVLFAGGACGACMRDKQHVIVEDVERDPLFEELQSAARDMGFRAGYSTPLISRGGHLIGVLSIHFRKPHRPSDRKIHMIDLCARQAAACIENAQLYGQLRETDRRKDEFLAVLAHELRNPLAPIMNALQLLQLSDGAVPAAQRARDIIERQANHMVRLVDDLLEVSRITRGKIELRKDRIDLGEVIASAVETSRPMIESAQHALTISVADEPIALDADRMRLAQVIANLLNNASKYTPPGGSIRVSASREGALAVVAVRDTGIGIAAETLPRIFDMFVQSDVSTGSTQGGLGIGLHLAKTLVDMHGGRIAVASDGLGRGSEFTVWLPIASPEVASAPTPSPRKRHLRARRILVLDDASDAAQMLGDLLEALGHHVHVAMDAGEALRIARAERPAIVISDLGMPVIDGFEFARRLREQPGLSNVVLVALTGYDQPTYRERAHRAGFDFHLVKPVRVHDIEALLASVP